MAGRGAQSIEAAKTLTAKVNLEAASPCRAAAADAAYRKSQSDRTKFYSGQWASAEVMIRRKLKERMFARR